MSGHTEGPWFGGSTVKDGSYCIVGDGDSVVCEFPNRAGRVLYADARLISAAPDLLWALQALDSLWSESAVGAVDFGHAIEMARAAIAKATGATA